MPRSLTRGLAMMPRRWGRRSHCTASSPCCPRPWSPSRPSMRKVRICSSSIAPTQHMASA
eukprot:6822128-Heterocapsa_arctica.AAC.1